ncbi:DUF4240 domain-containing protein [Muricauda sp. 2012CJ35-5]|uniref:DUF4240 domain-containing protein n=1 Tax=Flagellimonas spongiicola TaxID=2942208 RepID=A0ABT0PUD5_9FLAO|nr:DUF4240 domain-containing protein [Allomuricauda spongiicola]MCL6275000.1 DUF4240 domain-containing protein [Allomuricauda spongiicola]
MGFFDKLFGNSSQIQATSELLNEEVFWNIVDLSLQKTNNQDDQERFLIKEIQRLSPKEIIGFRLRTDKLLYDTYNSEMWCAGYIMNGGCSDDGFEYFRNWVISRGKDVYYSAKENPDTLISQYDESIDIYDFESFWYVALEAFSQKTGKELYDYISEDFQFGEGNYPQFEFNWSEEKPETMKGICPKLYDKMWR